jgi:hypothetical protein
MSWGYVAVAAGTVVAGAISADASRSAARKQEKATEKAIREQRAAREAQEARLAPFAKPGEAALQQQAALTGLGTPEQQQEAFAAFADSPGQQFLRDQQERALLRSASAIGGLGGGNIRTALQRQAFQRAQTDIGQQFNRLASISGTAQTAATNIGQFGGQAAANIGQLQQAGGAARASGILGQSQAAQQTIGGLAGLAAQSGALSQPQQQPTLEQQLRAQQGIPATTGTVLTPQSQRNP